MQGIARNHHNFILVSCVSLLPFWDAIAPILPTCIGSASPPAVPIRARTPPQRSPVWDSDKASRGSVCHFSPSPVPPNYADVDDIFQQVTVGAAKDPRIPMYLPRPYTAAEPPLYA